MPASNIVAHGSVVEDVVLDLTLQVGLDEKVGETLVLPDLLSE